MPPAAVIVLVLVVAIAASLVHGRWQRRRVLARLREEWGRPVPPRSLDDDRVSEAWQELRTAGRNSDGIDDRTWADLDLDRVFATIDRTRTALGRQLLYWRLRAGATWTESPRLEALAARFQDEPALRQHVGLQLTRAGKSLGYGLWVITRPDLIVVRWWYWFFPLLACAMLASIVAFAFDPRALLVAVAIAVLNMVVRMATAWQIPGLLAPMRQIGPLIRTARQLSKAVDDGSAESRNISKKIGRLRQLRRIAWWVTRDPAASGDIVASLWEYLNILFILDANALLFSARRLRRLGPLLGEVAQWVGDVDVALGVASLRAEPRSWCRPTQGNLVTARAAGLWHPLIPSPVLNDVELVPGRGIIITGANMSGKSTYLRAIGIAALLARAIDTCPAASWEGRLFRVRSLIGRNDDLAAGKSYYQVEADGVVALLSDAREEIPTLFLLDELLRGTNTIERLAAGDAVLRTLLTGDMELSPHVVVVATHDGELVSMLGHLYSAFHFRETIGADGLSFDYQRRVGPASTRTAIALLEATGAPKEMVMAARARAEQLDAASLLGGG